MNKRISLATLQLFFAFYCFSQQQDEKTKRMVDSLTAVYMEDLALKTPLLRQTGVTFESFGGGSIRSKLNNHPFFKSKLEMTRITAYLNVPVAHFGKNILSMTFAARHQKMNLYRVENRDPDNKMEGMEINKSILTATFSYTRLDSLFNRPVIYTGSATLITDPEDGQSRATFTGGIIFTIKRTATSTFSVGLIGILDPSSPVPVAPYIQYYKTFPKPKLELFLDASRIALRKELTPKHFLWASNALGGNLSLFQIDRASMPAKSVFTTFEIKSGLIYEYRMNKKVVLTLAGGMLTTISSKMLKANSTTNPFIVATHNPVPYFQAGLSVLPFWKGFAR